METPRPGDRIGLFELKEMIGAGSAGTVFRALHTQTKADVALKLVHESKEGFFRRVYLELDTLRSIRHENVVRVYAAGRDGPFAYLAMEYIDGVVMRTWIDASTGDDRIERILRAGVQIATGLAAVHEAGVVHRDLKPENVLVKDDGTVKLLDFGTARFIDGADVDNQVAGTLRYMAPEQLAGTEIDRRADLFSLGVVLFEMIAGRAPHVASDTAHLILAQCTERAAPIASFAPELAPSAAAIIDRLLSTAPADRPRSAHEVVAQLTKALGERMEAVEERAVVLASRFVERKPLVKSILARALRQEGGVIVLHGTAGIGLSRLLQEVRGDFLVRGGRPALVKGGSDILLDVLDALAGPLVPADTRDALLGEDRELLLDSFPELRRKGEKGAEARPYQRVRLATARLLKRAASQSRPLLIAIDDAEKVHPADLRCLVGHGLLLLATHRPERMEIVGEMMEIPPLSPGAMAEMARSVIGDAGATLAWEESELLAGKPEELMRRAHQWALAERPTRMQLEEEAGPGTRWETAIERAERAFQNKHPSAVLAYLQEPDEPPPGTGILRYRIERISAEAQFLAGDDRQALVHATHAAEVAPTEADRNRTRLLGARCALRRGHYGACLEEALYSWHQAQALQEVDLATQWAALEVSTLTNLGRIYEAQLVLERASVHLPSAGPEGRLALEWAGVRVAVVLCEWNEALMRIAEVRSLIQSPRRPRAEAGMYFEEGRIELRRGQVGRALKLLGHAASILEPLGDAELQMRTWFELCHAQTLDGKMEAARRSLDSMVAIATRTESRHGLIRALVIGLRHARLVADTELTLDLLERVAQLPPNWSDEPAASVLHSERALALVLLGDTDGAQRALQIAQRIDVEDPHDTLLVRLHELQLQKALQLLEGPGACLEIAQEADGFGLGHIARMARGLAIHAGADLDVRAMVEDARKAGDLLAATWAGAVVGRLPAALEDAGQLGFKALLAEAQTTPPGVKH